MYDPWEGMGDSSLKFHSKQNWVCEKIPSSSKVLNQSLRVCTLSASNTEVNGRNRFLWTFLNNIPTNFPLDLWNHLEFLHTLWLDCWGTLIGCPSNLLEVQLRLHYEYSLGNKVYTFFWSRVYIKIDRWSDTMPPGLCHIARRPYAPEL